MWKLSKQLALIAILVNSTALLSQEEKEKEKEIDTREFCAISQPNKDLVNVLPNTDLGLLSKQQISIIATLALSRLSADRGIATADVTMHQTICKLIEVANISDLKLALMFNAGSESWVTSLMKQKVCREESFDGIVHEEELEKMLQPRDASAFATVMLRQLANMETVDEEKVKLLVKHATISDLYIALLLNPAGHQYVINAMREKVFADLEEQNPEKLSKRIDEQAETNNKMNAESRKELLSMMLRMQYVDLGVLLVGGVGCAIALLPPAGLPFLGLGLVKLGQIFYLRKNITRIDAQQ